MSQFQALSKLEKPLLGVKVRARLGPERKIRLWLLLRAIRKLQKFSAYCGEGKIQQK